MDATMDTSLLNRCTGAAHPMPACSLGWWVDWLAGWLDRNSVRVCFAARTPKLFSRIKKTTAIFPQCPKTSAPRPSYDRAPAISAASANSCADVTVATPETSSSIKKKMGPAKGWVWDGKRVGGAGVLRRKACWGRGELVVNEQAPTQPLRWGRKNWSAAQSGYADRVGNVW